MSKKAMTQESIDKIKEFIVNNERAQKLLSMFNYEKRNKLDPVEKATMDYELKAMLSARNLKDNTINEMLTSGHAEFLIPQVVIGAVLEGAEPMQLFSPLFQTIPFNAGNVVEFPALGELRAFPVAEGQEFPEQDFEMTQYRNLTIRVGKFGLMLRITEETIENSQWDVMGYWLRAAGRAMTRLKEQQCAVAMTRFGHVVFDADSTDPQYQPTGLNSAGALNSTMSIMDFIDMMATVMYNGHNVTDLIMHPLAWLTFLKNEILGAYSKSMLSYDNVWAVPPGGISMDSPQGIIQRVVPLGVNVILSPMAPLDRVNKKFDIYAIDRNNLGVIIQREAISTESFDDPNRDITCLKIKEKYGVGIVDEGRGIAVCRNIALAPTYNAPMLVSNI